MGSIINCVLNSNNVTVTSHSLAPSGTIVMYCNATPPNGWLICNGSSVNNIIYPALFEVIGTTFGGSAPDFNLPNLTDRIPLGSNVDGNGGSLNHTHSINHQHNNEHSHNVSHTHSMTTHTHTVNISGHTHSTTPTHTHYFENHAHSFLHTHPASTGGANISTYTGSGSGYSLLTHGHSSITSGGPNNGWSSVDGRVIASSPNTTSLGAANTDVFNNNNSVGGEGMGPSSTSASNNVTSTNTQEMAVDGMPPYLVVYFIIKY